MKIRTATGYENLSTVKDGGMKTIVVVSKCPSCRKEEAYRVPEWTGKGNVTCRHCGGVFTVEVAHNTPGTLKVQEAA